MREYRLGSFVHGLSPNPLPPARASVNNIARGPYPLLSEVGHISFVTALQRGFQIPSGM